MAANITKRHRQPDIMCLQMDKNATTYEALFLSLNQTCLINTDLTTSLWERKRTEEHVKLCAIEMQH